MCPCRFAVIEQINSKMYKYTEHSQILTLNPFEARYSVKIAADLKNGNNIPMNYVYYSTNKNTIQLKKKAYFIKIWTISFVNFTQLKLSDQRIF